MFILNEPRTGNRWTARILTLVIQWFVFLFLQLWQYELKESAKDGFTEHPAISKSPLSG